MITGSAASCGSPRSQAVEVCPRAKAAEQPPPSAARTDINRGPAPARPRPCRSNRRPWGLKWRLRTMGNAARWCRRGSSSAWQTGAMPAPGQL